MHMLGDSPVRHRYPTGKKGTRIRRRHQRDDHPAYGVLPVRSVGEMVFEVLGREPNIVVETIRDNKIRRMRRMALVYPKMRTVAFYLETAKYCSGQSRRPAVRRAHAEGVLREDQGPRVPRRILLAANEVGTELTPTAF